MYCLHCGDCCLRMSPLGSPCPKVVKQGGLYFCRRYESRPRECENHRFDARFCPIGMDVLELRYPEDTDRIREIIDTTMLAIIPNSVTEKINKRIDLVFTQFPIGNVPPDSMRKDIFDQLLEKYNVTGDIPQFQMIDPETGVIHFSQEKL